MFIWIFPGTIHVIIVFIRLTLFLCNVHNHNANTPYNYIFLWIVSPTIVIVRDTTNWRHCVCDWQNTFVWWHIKTHTQTPFPSPPPSLSRYLSNVSVWNTHKKRIHTRITIQVLFSLQEPTKQFHRVLQ